MTRFVRPLTVAMVVFGLTVPAAAQRDVRIEKFSPALDEDGFIGIDGTRTPGPWRWSTGLSIAYSKDPLVAVQPGDDISIIGHRLSSDFFFQLGIAGRFAVAFDVPMVLYQRGDTEAAALGLGGLTTNAFGDIRFLARYRFIGEASGADHPRHEGPGAALVVGTTAPTGTRDAFAGEGSAITTVALLGDFHLLGAGAGATVAWNHRFHKREIGELEFHDELEFGLGLKMPIPVIHDFLGLVEVRGSTNIEKPFAEEADTVVEGDLAFRLIRHEVAFTAGIGMGLTGGVGSPSIRGLFSMSWAPSDHDEDADGIDDAEDQCRLAPEDPDGFEDENGCPDDDNDGDMVLDDDDRCPVDAALEGHDENEDGCTDEGAELEVDAAPPEPAQLADDNDGVADADDLCPTEAEDRDGYSDTDGCPDPDNDADGRQDPNDACPDVAEDNDGVEDDDGCPDVDNDHDGVVDTRDQCPTEAETINGQQDDDGCADRGGRALWEAAGTRGESDYRLEGKLRFGSDDSLKDRALPYVDQLARHLVGLGPYRWVIHIGGWSDARVFALTEALVARDVPRERFSIEADESLRAAKVIVDRADRPAALGAPAAPAAPQGPIDL